MDTHRPGDRTAAPAGASAGGALTAAAAAEELALVRAILDRTQRRLDPHAFHFIGWGAVVLIWYPLDNLFRMQGRPASWTAILIAAALATGIALGLYGEWRLARRGGTAGEDTVFSRQVNLVVWGTIGPAALLSALGPATQTIPGASVPVIWGFAYAVLAYSMGVIYSREFLWAGIAIFAGTVAALLLPAWSGFILGPSMGLGLLVPGIISERRVRARREADADAGSD